MVRKLKTLGSLSSPSTNSYCLCFPLFNKSPAQYVNPIFIRFVSECSRMT